MAPSPSRSSETTRRAAHGTFAEAATAAAAAVSMSATGCPRCRPGFWPLERNALRRPRALLALSTIRIAGLSAVKKGPLRPGATTCHRSESPRSPSKRCPLRTARSHWIARSAWTSDPTAVPTWRPPQVPTTRSASIPAWSSTDAAWAAATLPTPERAVRTSPSKPSTWCSESDTPWTCLRSPAARNGPSSIESAASTPTRRGITPADSLSTGAMGPG